jgi:hypothetical protein
LPTSSEWLLEEGWAINNSGQIVAEGINPEGQVHAFLLDLTASPTPEPASWFLFGGAAAMLGVARKMRRAWLVRALD